MSDADGHTAYMRVCVLLSAHRNVYYCSCRSCYNYVTATTMYRNGKQVNTPPLGYSVRDKRHSSSRKCLHAWADRRGSTHRVSQQQCKECEPIHHGSTQWRIHHSITQLSITINVLINLKGPNVYVILIGASYIYMIIVTN